MAKKREHEIIDGIIREMIDAGLSYERILKVIKMARGKLKAMKGPKQ